MAIKNKIIAFKGLDKADLFVDAVYKGGGRGDIADDPISKLLGVSNQGGFRRLGSVSPFNIKLVVLYSSLNDPDWPDYIDDILGHFVYYGDNKTPGHELHDTNKKGNKILKQCFDYLHQNERRHVPPFFVFTKGKEGRGVIFRGLAIPGGENISSADDLSAIWKSKNGNRFQNYKSFFTILDVSSISRAWVDDIKNGDILSGNCPKIWKEWVELGRVRPLISERVKEYRTKDEQLPDNEIKRKIIKEIHSYFSGTPQAFEECAVDIARFMDGNISSCELTRWWRDGGRDAIGKYRIGGKDNFINVEFALEAKCYSINNSVKIKDTTRLISRIKYREFGIFVTTSYVDTQAYKEIIEDRHPIIIISANDIANILIANGFNTLETVKNWLKRYKI